MLEAAQAARLELMVANNRYSRSIALKNADHFVRAKVDLVFIRHRLVTPANVEHVYANDAAAS